MLRPIDSKGPNGEILFFSFLSHLLAGIVLKEKSSLFTFLFPTQFHVGKEKKNVYFPLCTSFQNNKLTHYHLSTLVN